MDKILEFVLYTLFTFVILLRFQLLFNNHLLSLFLSMFLFSLMFEMFMAIYKKVALKVDLILLSVSKSLLSVAIFVILYELLKQIPEMSESFKMLLISVVIGLMIKLFNNYYNFSRV